MVADATPISLSETIASLRYGMGRPANLFAIPPPLLSDLFRVCRISETWEKLAGNLVLSIDKLNRIGYSPVVATSQGLAAMTRTLPRSAAALSAANR